MKFFENLGIRIFNWCFPLIEPEKPQPSNTPTPPPIAPPSPVLPPIPAPVEPSHAWADYPADGKLALRIMVCQKCLAAPFNDDKMTDFFATIEGESGFNPYCENINKDGTGDYGLCQLNSYWYLPPNNLTPQQAEDNPEKCVDIMVNAWKQGRMTDWVAYKFGGYIQHIPLVKSYLPGILSIVAKTSTNV